jgi:hypothetical protein
LLRNWSEAEKYNKSIVKTPCLPNLRLMKSQPDNDIQPQKAKRKRALELRPDWPPALKAIDNYEVTPKSSGPQG